ncbi:methyltransferase domain-containing protein [Chloroflexota bacterium]
MSRYYSIKQLASSYDQARCGHPDVIAEIVGRFPLPKDEDILDIGCGTGNETVLLQKYAGKSIWAVDNSRPMLDRTNQKLGKNVNTVLGDFENLAAFPNDRFAYVFSSFTYQQALSPKKFFQEVNRILQPSGRFVLLCATLEQAQQKPLVQFFPRMAELDAGRYLSLDDLIKTFWESGFVAVCEHSIYFETRKIDKDYLTKVESCLVDSSLIVLKEYSEDEFRDGVERMRSAIDKGLCYPIDRTVISGVKPLDLKIHRENYFANVFSSTHCRSVNGGALNSVFSVDTGSGEKLIAKQGTITSASNHLGNKLKSMSPERTRDEYTSLVLLNNHRDLLTARIPAVYGFDEANNVLLIEDISDHSILMSRQDESTYISRELENAQILGEFLGRQHLVFLNKCPYVRGSESRDMKKWQWIFRIRTTDLLQSMPDLTGRLKSAMELKTEDIFRNYITNTLVNPDLCPKNIFIYNSAGSLGVFDFEFCTGLGDPMYDLGFIVAHLIMNTGIYTGHFSTGTSIACCDKYQVLNPSEYRKADVTWYAACTIIYRFRGASPLAIFRNHNEAPTIVEAAAKIIVNMGGELQELTGSRP